MDMNKVVEVLSLLNVFGIEVQGEEDKGIAFYPKDCAQEMTIYRRSVGSRSAVPASWFAIPNYTHLRVPGKREYYTLDMKVPSVGNPQLMFRRIAYEKGKSVNVEYYDVDSQENLILKERFSVCEDGTVEYQKSDDVTPDKYGVYTKSKKFVNGFAISPEEMSQAVLQNDLFLNIVNSYGIYYPNLITAINDFRNSAKEIGIEVSNPTAHK